MPTIVDAIIILVILACAVLGLKKGVIQSATEFIGTILVLGVSFVIKNPVAEFLMNNFPFFEFKGALAGVSVLNIVIYEVIAYLLVALILWVLLRVIVTLTGILEKILSITIILGIPSKILGFIFGLAEGYIIVFVGLFCINQFASAYNKSIDSNYMNSILSSTPVLSDIVSESYDSINEIIDLAKVYENTTDKDSYNKEALDILLKNKIVTTDTAEKLIKKGKIKMAGSDELINKYKGEKENG